MLFHTTNMDGALKIIRDRAFKDNASLGYGSDKIFPGLYLSYGDATDALARGAVLSPETKVVFALTPELLNAENYHGNWSSSNGGRINEATMFPWIFREMREYIMSSDRLDPEMDWPEVVFHDSIRTSNIVAIVAETQENRRALRQACRNEFQVVDCLREVYYCPLPTQVDIPTASSFVYYWDRNKSVFVRLRETAEDDIVENSYTRAQFEPIFAARHCRDLKDYVFNNEREE